MRFICWLWSGGGFWKPVVKYGPRHVEVLAAMLHRHGGHQLTCIHDGTFQLPRHIDAVQMPEAVASLPDYLPKLWAWSPELQAIIGERYASIDLDVVVLGDVAPVLAGHPVILWDEAVGEPYNTSLFAVDPGHGQEVWTQYTPDRLQRARRAATRWTGDQSWVAHVLGSRVPTFGLADGVLRYRGGLHQLGVPAGTKAVFFCGPMCPSTQREHVNWVRENWF